MRHVKESSGKQPERGIGSGKAEAYDCEPREFQESSFARGERSGQPRESRSWKQRARTTNEGPTMNSQERQKTDAQTSNTRKLGRRDESSSLRGHQSLRELEARIPKFAALRLRALGESLQEHKGKGDCCRRCTTSVDRRVQDHHMDLENAYVGISEGRDSYRTRLH